MAEKEVKLLGFWPSPYTTCVRWALELKGVEYDYKEEEDFPATKSPLLLQSNPIYKKAPVLIQNGRPVVESLIIIEYIDEMWSHDPLLLPQDPFHRATSRFWATFAQEKCVPAIVNTFMSFGKELETSANEAREHLKILEGGIKTSGGAKPFWGGDTLGLVDIGAAWIGYWGRNTGEVVGIKLIDEETMPLLTAWFDNVLHHPILKQCLPPWDKLLMHSQMVRMSLVAAGAGAGSSSNS